MSIKVSDKYSIEADEYQLIVVENKIAKKGKNAGEAYQTTVAYVNDVTHALQVIYGRETRKWVAEHEATLKEEEEKLIKEIADNYQNDIPIILYEAMYNYEVEIDD